MRAQLIVMAAVVAVLAVPGATVAAPPQSIAFTSDRACDSGHTDIYTMNADGSNVRRITSTCLDSEPAWSPDGSQIAFESTRDGVRPEVWVMNADGSGPHRISPAGQIAEHPSWSRQGLIAFDDFSGIFTVHADGSGLTRVTEKGTQPSWSPDGTHIAYTFHDASTNTFDVVAVVGSDGTGSRVVARGTTPAYAPDGDHLAWAARDDAGDAALVVAHADGTSPQAIFTAQPTYTYELEPAWSPDSATIAFDQGPNAEIYSIAATGGPPVRLTTSAAADTDASWRPVVPSTGLAIASVRFAHGSCSSRPGRAGVSVVDAQGRPLGAATTSIGGVQARTNSGGIAVLALPKTHRKGRTLFTVRAGLTGRPSATKRISLPACR